MGEWTYFRSHRLYKQNQGTKRSTRRCSNGRISAHTGHINKTRVPKEAQDDALSNGTTGDRQTSTGRPTRGDVVRMTVLSSFSVVRKELRDRGFSHFLARKYFCL